MTQAQINRLGGKALLLTESTKGSERKKIMNPKKKLRLAQKYGVKGFKKMMKPNRLWSNRREEVESLE